MQKRVAVLEDDADQAALFCEVLTEEGYDCDSYSRGVEDLAAMRARVPSTLILDLHLPDVDDGWSVVDALRADPVLETTRIILTSADVASLRSANEYLEQEGIVVLRKPFDLRDLLDVLSQTISDAEDPDSPLD